MYHLFNKFPVINLEDIVLRELSADDALNYYEYMNQEQMKEFITAANLPSNLSQAIEEVNYWSSLFRNKRSFYWAVALRKNDMLIGTAGFNVISQHHLKAEISYDLNPKFWRQGIMSEAIGAILNFADLNLRLVRIQATVIQDNISSIKLLDRCGFVKEGEMKKFEIVNNVHKDYYMYARII